MSVPDPFHVALSSAIDRYGPANVIIEPYGICVPDTAHVFVTPASLLDHCRHLPVLPRKPDPGIHKPATSPATIIPTDNHRARMQRRVERILELMADGKIWLAKDLHEIISKAERVSFDVTTSTLRSMRARGMVEMLPRVGSKPSGWRTVETPPVREASPVWSK